MGQQLTGNGADSHPRSGFPCAGSLQDVSNVVVTVLDDTCQIGMAWPGPRHDRTFRAARIRRLFGLDMHGPLPVLPVFVGDYEGDGRPRRQAMADTTKRLRAIGFDRHATPAAVSTLASSQFARKCGEVDLQAGRKAFQYGNQCLAVRFTSSEKTQ